ncbi:EI24 domain-containing protein [Pseudooceanicola spongiae]|uniref:EI24 domain-containing protein n=1 Tax=Pseudooceanicola spongiae TaxID=2613965 RepID=UPI001865E09E|nr:EI24 domain-containing protein [Pseudooceanicola spongiae]
MAVGVIFSAFTRAVGQVFDPRFRRVLFLGLGLTIGLLVVVTAVVMWLLGWAVGDAVTLPFVGPVTWLNDLASASGFLVMMLASVFLMIPISSAMMGFFLEEVAEAVEEEHYPHLPPAEGVPFMETLMDTLGFTGVIILANLLALILYLIFAPLAPFIFWGVNGFLLGREYFTLAAMRRIGREAAQSLRRRHAGAIWIAGTLMAVPLSIPILNLLVPIVGAATFTHIYHGLAKRQGAQVG